MDWYRLFRQHILDRGIEYYEDGQVINFDYTGNEINASVDGSDIYDVKILLDEEDVIDMYCSCLHAADGHNCKHMAAVLFKFEEVLAKQDEEAGYALTTVGEREEDVSQIADLKERLNEQKAEVIELVSQIPEDKVRELLIGFVLADEGLKNQLQLKYAFKMNSQLMLNLRTELDTIKWDYCRAGYVDWYHASAFTSALSATC